MKFGGKSLTTKNRKLVKLQRSDGTNTQTMELLVSPLPADLMDDLRAKGAIKTVEPPKKWVEIKPGLVKRDPVTNEPIAEHNWNDPAYLKVQTQMVKRMQALAFREALKNDATVAWETAEPAADAPADQWEKFADAVVKEVFDPESGMEAKEVDHIIDEAGKLALTVASQLTEEAALKNF